MDSSKQKLWEQCEEKQPAFIDFLKELIRLSEQGEAAIQARVAEKLSKLGCDVETIRYYPPALSTRHEFADPSTVDPSEHISVAGKLPGISGKPSLMLFAQGDTMLVGDTDSWQRPPFAGQIENGRLYGWGVADDLVGVAAMIYAIEAVLTAGLKPKGDLVVASTPSKRRARGIISVLEHGYETDAVIYVHPAESGAGLEEIKEATPGLLSFRITVPGRLPDTKEPGHTPFHHIAVDPIEKAILIIQALQEFNAKRGAEVHHPIFDQAIGRSTNLHIAYIHCGEENNLNRVSAECVLAGSITLVPGETLTEVQKHIAQVIENAAGRDPWLKEHAPKLEWLVGTQGAEVRLDHPLYQTAKRAITEVTGKEPHPNPLHAASDIRNPMLFNNIPTIGLGPRGGGLAETGKHDEWVNVDESLQTVKVLGSIILDWCGV